MVALRISSNFYVELLVDGSHVFYIPIDRRANPGLYQKLVLHRKRAVETVEAKAREKKDKAESARATAAVEREKSVAKRISEIFS